MACDIRGPPAPVLSSTANTTKAKPTVTHSRAHRPGVAMYLTGASVAAIRRVSGPVVAVPRWTACTRHRARGRWHEEKPGIGGDVIDLCHWLTTTLSTVDHPGNRRFR